MKIEFPRNYEVFYALLHRDMHVLSQSIMTFIFDSFCLLISEIIVFGYLFPIMGLPFELIGSTFIGGLTFLFLSVCFSQAYSTASDLKFARTIDYHLTLPINKYILWLHYTISGTLKTITITAPLFVFGFLLLKSRLTIVQFSPIAFCVIYILAILFLTTLTNAFAYYYEYDWYFANIWARRLMPLLCAASTTSPWIRIYEVSHPVGILFLCNPLTYIAEGLKSALFGSDMYISHNICTIMLLLFTTLSFLFFAYSANKRLNPT